MATFYDTLLIKGRDQNSNDIEVTIKYINPEVADTVVRSTAYKLMGLTTNSLLSITRITQRDITNAS